MVLFRRQRRETCVQGSKLFVSRRADELERFQKWSDTPAAVEVREARVTGDTAYAELPLYLKCLTTKVLLRHEIGADDPLLPAAYTLAHVGSGAVQTRQSVLFGQQYCETPA